MAGLEKEPLGVAQHIWKELLPSILLTERDPGWQLLSLPRSYPRPGPPVSLISSFPSMGCGDPRAPPDLGCFSAELVAHGDLVQGAVWSQDGALVGTTCKVSMWTVRLI